MTGLSSPRKLQGLAGFEPVLSQLLNHYIILCNGAWSGRKHLPWGFATPKSENAALGVTLCLLSASSETLSWFLTPTGLVCHSHRQMSSLCLQLLYTKYAFHAKLGLLNILTITTIVKVFINLTAVEKLKPTLHRMETPP